MTFGPLRSALSVFTRPRKPWRGVAAAVLAGGLAATGLVAAPVAPAEAKSLVSTIRCDSINPWGGGRLPVYVDVFNQIRHPSDGLAGPAIELVASSPTPPVSFLPPLVEYTAETTVNWRNTATGRSGTVRVPTRSSQLTWTVVLHPGAGPTQFTIHQKIGAMAWTPMVNPQYSTCRGAATA